MLGTGWQDAYYDPNPKIELASITLHHMTLISLYQNLTPFYLNRVGFSHQINNRHPC